MASNEPSPVRATTTPAGDGPLIWSPTKQGYRPRVAARDDPIVSASPLDLSERLSSPYAASLLVHPHTPCIRTQVRRSRQSWSIGVKPFLSSRHFLQSFESSEETGSYGFDKPVDYPPTCSYSNESHCERSELLAVGIGQGNICLVDTSTSQTSGEDTEPVLFRGQNPQSSIHEIQWRKDDRQLAAAGQELAVWDVESQRALGYFTGHTAAAKTLAWDPGHHSLIAIGGRDGDINIWDVRSRSGAYDEEVDPALVIWNAQDEKSRHSSSPTEFRPMSAVKSVTSLRYLPDRSHMLISAGTSDGILFQWDIRSCSQYPVQKSDEDPTVKYTESPRPRGITSIDFGNNDSMLYGLGMDGRVYQYLTPTLQACPPLPAATAIPRSQSFSSKLAASRCGRWLAAAITEGSPDGSTYLYDISAGLGSQVRAPARLSKGHSDTTGMSWSPCDVLAACLRDSRVYIWRPA